MKVPRPANSKTVPVGHTLKKHSPEVSIYTECGLLTNSSVRIFAFELKSPDNQTCAAGSSSSQCTAFHGIVCNALLILACHPLDTFSSKQTSAMRRNSWHRCSTSAGNRKPSQCIWKERSTIIRKR